MLYPKPCPPFTLVFEYKNKYNPFYLALNLPDKTYSLGTCFS